MLRKRTNTKMDKAEFIQKTITILKDNLAFSFCFALVCVILLFTVGCDSTVKSINDPATQVNRYGLDAEVSYFLDIAENRYKALDQQDALKNLIFDHAILYTQTGAFDPVGLLSTIFGLLGVGAVTDNVRQRAKARKVRKTA